MRTIVFERLVQLIVGILGSARNESFFCAVMLEEAMLRNTRGHEGLQLVLQFVEISIFKRFTDAFHSYK
ncbi:hypothetical protein D3C87_1378840 [compost metagenome]